jgi:GT2 family glycosyltransferase
MKIIFCLPGREFSGKFLQSWTELMYSCLSNGIQPIISQHYSPLLYYVRNMCLGGDTIQGIEQKPFQGKIDYDYIMWIDSDMIFNPNQFFKLLDHNKDIVSGIYKMQNNFHYATVENWDHDYFVKNGTYEFLNQDTVKQKKDLFPVAYTGFGWMLIKKGVFESLEYPWFQPTWKEYEFNGKTIREFTMEDVAFCDMIKDKGFKIWVDPKIVIGHEKMMVLV